jgi:predicted DNA-binding transcriptional regulator YafY
VRLEDRFLYLPFAPKDYASKVDELDDLFQAVSDLRPLQMVYRSHGKDQDERISVHPYAMVFHRDAIYCVGYHLGRGEIRTFLVDRMRDTQCNTTERFQLPEDFDIEDYFQGEFGVWRSTEKHRIVVEFDAAAAEYVRARKVHQSQRLVPIAGGGIRLSMTVGDLTPVVSWILEWGPRARVVEPPKLVSRVASELRLALQQYEVPPTTKRKARRVRTDR